MKSPKLDIGILAPKICFSVVRPFAASLAFAAAILCVSPACKREIAGPDLSTPRKAVQAFDDAVVCNNIALARSLAKGDDGQFSTAKAGIDLAHLINRFAVAELKRFDPTSKTEDSAKIWAKADEKVEGNNATVSLFLGPSFALEKIGETWRIDLGSSQHLRPFEGANIEKISGALTAITERLESGQFKTKEEYESEFDTKVRPLTVNVRKQTQAATPAPKSDNETIGTAGQPVTETSPSSAAAAGGYEAGSTAPTQMGHMKSAPAPESSQGAASQPSETGGGQLPEYTAAEATKHIGENAIVLVRVDCIECGTGCYLSFGDCGGDATFFIYLPGKIRGPEADVYKWEGTTIAVTGKIKKGQVPYIEVESTSQIALPKEPTSNELEASIAREETLLKANSKDAKAYYRRGVAREKKAALQHVPDEYHTAIDDYNQALKLDPSNSDALVHIGDCCAALQDYVAAKRAWDKAIEVSPEANELLKDSTAKERGRYTYAAIHDLDKLTNLEPKNAALYYRKAGLYLMDGNTDNANLNFRRAAQLEPTNVTYADKAAHPVAAAKRQLTVEEMKDAFIEGIGKVGTALVGAAARRDMNQQEHVRQIIEASGGAKIKCPKCRGSGLAYADTYNSAPNPYKTGTWDYNGFELNREGRVLKTCDRCGGTGVVDK